MADKERHILIHCDDQIEGKRQIHLPHRWFLLQDSVAAGVSLWEHPW